MKDPDLAFKLRCEVIPILRDKVVNGSATELEIKTLQLLDITEPTYRKRQREYLFLFTILDRLYDGTFYNKVKGYYNYLQTKDTLSEFEMELWKNHVEGGAKHFDMFYRHILKVRDRYTKDPEVIHKQHLKEIEAIKSEAKELDKLLK